MTARRGTAVSNVPTRADCRNTGKRLNEGIVASSDGGAHDHRVTSRDECLTSDKIIFFSLPRTVSFFLRTVRDDRARAASKYAGRERASLGLEACSSQTV